MHPMRREALNEAGEYILAFVLPGWLTRLIVLGSVRRLRP